MLLQFHKFLSVLWERIGHHFGAVSYWVFQREFRKAFFILLKSGKHILHTFSRKCISNTCLSPQREHFWVLCSDSPSHTHICSVFNFNWCGANSHCTAVHQAALHVYLASVADILHCQKPPRFPSAGVFGMMLGNSHLQWTELSVFWSWSSWSELFLH